MKVFKHKPSIDLFLISSGGEELLKTPEAQEAQAGAAQTEKSLLDEPEVSLKQSRTEELFDPVKLQRGQLNGADSGIETRNNFESEFILQSVPVGSVRIGNVAVEAVERGGII